MENEGFVLSQMGSIIEGITKPVHLFDSHIKEDERNRAWIKLTEKCRYTCKT